MTTTISPQCFRWIKIDVWGFGWYLGGAAARERECEAVDRGGLGTHDVQEVSLWNNISYEKSYVCNTLQLLTISYTFKFCFLELTNYLSLFCFQIHPLREAHAYKEVFLSQRFSSQSVWQAPLSTSCLWKGSLSTYARQYTLWLRIHNYIFG